MAERQVKARLALEGVVAAEAIAEDLKVKKAVDFLRPLIINDPKPGTMSWA